MLSALFVLFDSNIQVKEVVKQLCQNTTLSSKSVRLNWEDVDNQALDHFKTVGTREIGNQRRFLIGDEYLQEFHNKFVEGANPLHTAGTWKGADGIFVREKLGVQIQDEVFEGMTLQNSYDNDGQDTEEGEKQNIYDKYRALLMEQSKTFQARVAVKTEEGAAAASSAPGTSSALDAPHVPDGDADVAAQGQASRRRGQVAPGAKPATAPNGKAEAKSKAKAKPKGRPPKSILAETNELVASFASSDMDNSLWWGSEARTQLKRLTDLKKQFNLRIQSATDADLIATLEPGHKKMGVLVLLLEAYQKSGLDSTAFIETYDCCLVSLRTRRSLSSCVGVTFAGNRVFNNV